MAKGNPVQRCLDDLVVKKVSFNDTFTANSSAMLPFKIGVSQLEVVKIYGLRIRWVVNPFDDDSILRWALIQKDEQELQLTTANQGGDLLTRDEDNDVLIRGAFTNLQNASPRREDVPYREDIWLSKPICIPRSPSIEIHVSVGDTPAIIFQAELYYQKTSAPIDIIRYLLKQWIGRKQDPVSNVPRVIDE